MTTGRPRYALEQGIRKQYAEDGAPRSGEPPPLPKLDKAPVAVEPVDLIQPNRTYGHKRQLPQRNGEEDGLGQIFVSGIRHGFQAGLTPELSRLA